MLNKRFSCITFIFLIYLFIEILSRNPRIELNGLNRHSLKEVSSDITDVSKKSSFHIQDQVLSDETPFVQIQNKFSFNGYLSPEENRRVKLCEENANADRQKHLDLFDKNKNVCVQHHTYLKDNDTVLIEVGGNRGRDSSLFAERYNSRQLILEPVEYFAKLLKEKFRNNSRVNVLNFGLGKKTETVYTTNRGLATSILARIPGYTNISVVNSTDFFKNIGVGVFSVDLLTMDCEGCELGVIESLLETNMITYFKNVQFESHGHLSKLKSQHLIQRYCVIQEYMSRTHRLTFQYKHVWENWRRLDLK